MTSNHDSSPDLSDRLYGWLLGLYPAPHRQAYGPLMQQLFRDLRREAARRAGARGLWACWSQVLFDLVFTAFQEHLQEKLSQMERAVLTWNELFLIVRWAAVTALAWAVSPINTLDHMHQTWADVAVQVGVYALCGLAMGIVAGIGQAHALSKIAPIDAPRWRWATLFGCAASFPVSLVLVTIFRRLIEGPLPLFEPTTTFYMSYPMGLASGGFVLGIAQWAVLRRMLLKRSAWSGLLWILGVFVIVWYGVVSLDIRPIHSSFDVLVSAEGVTTYVPLLNAGAPTLADLIAPWAALQRLQVGAIAGALQGALLMLILRQSITKSAVALAH